MIQHNKSIALILIFNNKLQVYYIKQLKKSCDNITDVKKNKYFWILK